jgi:hypothetical protein
MGIKNTNMMKSGPEQINKAFSGFSRPSGTVKENVQSLASQTFDQIGKACNVIVTDSIQHIKATQFGIPGVDN